MEQVGVSLGATYIDNPKEFNLLNIKQYEMSIFFYLDERAFLPPGGKNVYCDKHDST